MDSDLLNLKKKRFVSDPLEPVLSSPDAVAYQAFAFDAHSHRRIRILCKDGVNHSLAYLHLVDVVDNEPAFTRLALVFSHYVYRFEGKNLQQLTELMSEEKVKRIVEFNSARWAPPAAGEPIITRLEIRLRADPALADLLGAPKVAGDAGAAATA